MRLRSLAGQTRERLAAAMDSVAATLADFAGPREAHDGGAARPRNLPNRQQIRILIVAAVAAVMILGVIPALWHLVFAPASPTAPPVIPGTFRPTDSQWADLKIETIRARAFPGLVATDGSVATNDDTTTPVFSPYSGRVTRLIAKLGDHVEKGDPLMTIAATEAAQSQNDLITASDALSAARVQASVATANEARQHQLYQGGSAALKDWQQSQSDLAAAKAGLRTAEIGLAATRNKLRILGMSDRDIEALERTRAVEKISPDVTVFAPISGTVIQRQVGLGQFIQAGAANPVYSIGDLSTLWLIGNVREADAPLVRVNAVVEVRVMALPGRTFNARLSWVAPSIDPTTHRLAVRAEVQNPDGLLKPTMFATFFVHTGADRVSPAVPEQAVVYEGEEARVWIAHRDKSLGLRDIKPGRTQDGEIEALSGVRPGERIVTSGAVFIDRAAEPE